MAKNRARRGYEVLGEFKRLPDFTERAVCESCAVTRLHCASASKGSARRVSAACRDPALRCHWAAESRPIWRWCLRGIVPPQSVRFVCIAR